MTNPVKAAEAAEAALVRSRQAFLNAMELGLLPKQYHVETRQIVTEITVALALMDSRHTIAPMTRAEMIAETMERM